MSDIGKLDRGEKWKNIRSHYIAMGSPDNIKHVKWMDRQESIINDIKFYEDSLKEVKAEPEKPKGKRGR